MIILLKYRNTAATCCDNNLICIKKSFHCVEFNNLDRIRSRNSTAETFTWFFHYEVTFLAFFICFLSVHVTTKNFCWCVESIIIRIYDHLSKDCADCTVDTTVEKFFADSVLKVISDISLAHGSTYRHWGCCIVRMVLCKFIHCSVDHTNLRSITVCDSNLIACFDQISDTFGSAFNGYFLFWKCSSKCTVSQCNNDSFFHNISLSSKL